VIWWGIVGWFGWDDDRDNDPDEVLCNFDVDDVDDDDNTFFDNYYLFENWKITEVDGELDELLSDPLVLVTLIDDVEL
jgi:hypothetical protein